MNDNLQKQSTTIEYGLIIALYYVTGGAFSYTNYSMQIIAFFLGSLIICAIVGARRYVLRKSAFVAWMSLSFFAILVPLFFNDSISTYLAIILQLGIGLFCAAIIPPINFKHKYINVITFFAIISLIGYIIGWILPEVALRFPLTIGDASVDYYNAGIYVFMRPKGYDSFFLMRRNAGICWEPGCYQAFLNIGLLFLFNEEQEKHQKQFYLKFFVLIITIVTTLSTAGIVILCMLLVLYFPVWRTGLKGGWILLPLALLLVFWMYNHTELGEIIQTKVGREFGEDNGYIERLSLNKISYLVAPESGWPYIFGMSFSKWLTYDTSMWNSIIHSALCLGIPFTIIQLTGYWKGSRMLIRKTGVLFLVMIMCASTETLFWRVFFNTIAFYGWIGYRETSNDRGDISATRSIDYCT